MPEKGSIKWDNRKGHKRPYLVWYYRQPGESRGKHYYVYTNPWGESIKDEDGAKWVLAQIRAEWDAHVKSGGKIPFDIFKWTGKQRSNTSLYLEQWLNIQEAKVPHKLSPATYKGYRYAVKKHLIPFFEDNPVQLHEISYDLIERFWLTLKLEPKTAFNVVCTLRTCMRHAWKSRKISSVPPFPSKEEFNIPRKKGTWMPESRQRKVIQAIDPPFHQPIFLWWTLHLRRPCEAMALLKIDWDNRQTPESPNGKWIVCRSVSARKFVDRTKTKRNYVVGCVSEFWERMKTMYVDSDSPYFFTNPTGRKKGKPYTANVLRRLWEQACLKAGEDPKSYGRLWMYQGTRASRASQLHNEYGLSLDQLQTAGNWANRSSVEIYAETEVATQVSLLEGKVVSLRGRGADKKEAI